MLLDGGRVQLSGGGRNEGVSVVVGGGRKDGWFGVGDGVLMRQKWGSDGRLRSCG